MSAGRRMVSMDGNSAVAHVAYATNEVIAIYPITPSSPMGEESDAKKAKALPNIWGTVPDVTEMQSEAGAAGAVHGALTTGALTTTFTASQGLLLMIPNMYKIAGELTPTVFHVSARSLAIQALSIFGDHSDVMACRQTGWAMLASNSVQEVMDTALIAHAATLKTSIPFLHFFDGFRTSHEVQKIEELTYDDMRAMIDDDLVAQHRRRGLSPDHPTIKGTAQNPDVYFQGRESCNPYYAKVASTVQETMDQFAKITGRQYHLFDYVGAPDADRVVVMMGSGAEAVHDVVDYLVAQGEKVGLVKVRLYRPFDAAAMITALPKSVKVIGVLDRTKESGCNGEPLYKDVQGAVYDAVVGGVIAADEMPRVVGGRYGLGSKEFNPGMAKSVYDNLAAANPKNDFTVGIFDDVSNTSLPWDDNFVVEDKHVHRAMFFGLGSDGTVGANKNSIKIIGDGTDNYAQGYFVYDSKKSGSMTISHLRFSPKPIRSTYLINQADFVACHAFAFIDKFDMVKSLRKGGTFLLNSPEPDDTIWDLLPRATQRGLIDKQAKFYVIDAYTIAKDVGLGGRINVIMQAAFFAISGVLPEKQAMEMIENAVKKTYGSKGDKIVTMNINAAHQAKANIHQVTIPATVTSDHEIVPCVIPDSAPDFVKNTTAKMIAMEGDSLPVSGMTPDGTYPTGTTQYEKRNIALEIPVWRPEACIQCLQCSFVCPHATIRGKIVDAAAFADAPETAKSIAAKGKGMEGKVFTLQVAPEDCTGCGNCVDICPGRVKDAGGNRTEERAIMMEPQPPLRAAEVANWDFFLHLPETDRSLINLKLPKGTQLVRPLFEFNGACNGCGETPYVKLMTQLFGDRLMIGNATGCSSIYGGNLPTTPYCTREDGRGPTWSNSLFEDNAEFALGMRLTVDKLSGFAIELLDKVEVDAALVAAIKANTAVKEQAAIEEQRGRVDHLKAAIRDSKKPEARHLLEVADYLVPKSIWALGGDGWAYDIGYGGLDHVLASGRNINIMVLDTGVYSNTGGQMSKATPRGAVAKFATGGKDMPKKDLGAISMTYGYIYVAQVAYGGSMPQLVKAMQEAESYDGPSLVIAYSHCIAHGINMVDGHRLQKEAVENGFWPLFRFDPRLAAEGKPAMQLDSKEPAGDIAAWINSQNRFRILTRSKPERAAALAQGMAADVQQRWSYFKSLAGG